MTLAFSCHPSPKGPAPVRVECLVVASKDPQAAPNTWDYDIKIALGSAGWRGDTGSLIAVDKHIAHARAYTKVIEILGTWLADLYVVASKTPAER